MNPLIEFLNRAAGHVLPLAWPMFWQSCVLIAVVCAFEQMLRRRVGAAVRHALWLLVLVKLLLPPTLALPTGLAWWLPPPAPVPAASGAQFFKVTYGSPSPAIEAMAAPAAGPPSPALTTRAWLLLSWSTVSGSLLAWMLVLWRRGSANVHAAKPGPPWLNELADEARLTLGLRRPVTVRLTDRHLSPAVCGWLRPLVLLPRPVVESLSPVQLRAVLLHELIHVQRNDVPLNWLQTAFQIAWWWHPLLWFANARIRQLREEAVDDAVMLALRDDANEYAPTLLEVAKLACTRPLAGLALVGILESRRALRERIERLLDSTAPRTARVAARAVTSIAAFALIALPMGCAPVAKNSPGKGAANPATSVSSPGAPGGAGLNGSTNTAPGSPALLTRAYRLDAATFVANVGRKPGTPTGRPLQKTGADVTTLAQNFFAEAGIDFSGRQQVSYNVEKGLLLVRATAEALEKVDRILASFDREPPQILVAVQYLEVSEAALADLWRLLKTNYPAGSPWLAELDSLQAAALDSAVAAHAGTDRISAPKVITRSGQQARIEISETIQATAISARALYAPGVPDMKSVFVKEPLKTGPSLEVLPRLSTNRLAIELTVAAKVTEFQGFDTAAVTNHTVFIQGKRQTVSLPLAHVRTRHLSATASVGDDQTLLLGGPLDGNQPAERPGDGKKRLLLVIKASLADTGRKPDQ